MLGTMYYEYTISKKEYTAFVGLAALRLGPYRTCCFKQSVCQVCKTD